MSSRNTAAPRQSMKPQGKLPVKEPAKTPNVGSTKTVPGKQAPPTPTGRKSVSPAPPPKAGPQVQSRKSVTLTPPPAVAAPVPIPKPPDTPKQPPVIPAHYNFDLRATPTGPEVIATELQTSFTTDVNGMTSALTSPPPPILKLPLAPDLQTPAEPAFASNKTTNEKKTDITAISAIPVSDDHAIADKDRDDMHKVLSSLHAKNEKPKEKLSSRGLASNFEFSQKKSVSPAPKIISQSSIIKQLKKLEVEPPIEVNNSLNFPGNLKSGSPPKNKESPIVNVTNIEDLENGNLKCVVEKAPTSRPNELATNEKAGSKEGFNNYELLKKDIAIKTSQNDSLLNEKVSLENKLSTQNNHLNPLDSPEFKMKGITFSTKNAEVFELAPTQAPQDFLRPNLANFDLTKSSPYSDKVIKNLNIKIQQYVHSSTVDDETFKNRFIKEKDGLVLQKKATFEIEEQNRNKFMGIDPKQTLEFTNGQGFSLSNTGNMNMSKILGEEYKNKLNLDNTIVVGFGRLSQEEILFKLATLFKKIIVYTSKIESIRSEIFTAENSTNDLESIFQIYNENNKDFLLKFEFARMLNDMNLKISIEETERLIIYLNRIFDQETAPNQYDSNFKFENFCRFFCSGKINWAERKKQVVGVGIRRFSKLNEVQIAASDFHSMKQVIIYTIRKVEDLRSLVRILSELNLNEIFPEVASEQSNEITWPSLSKFLDLFKVLYMPEDLIHVFNEFGCLLSQTISLKKFIEFFKAYLWKI